MKTRKGSKMPETWQMVCSQEVRRAPLVTIGLAVALCISASYAESPGAGDVASAGLQAAASMHGSTYQLENAAIRAAFTVRDGHLRGLRVDDKLHSHAIDLDQEFTLGMADGATVRATDMRVEGAPVTEDLQPAASATRAAEQVAGKRICANLVADTLPAHVQWCLVLRDGSRYMRQTLTVRADDGAVPIKEIALLEFHDQAARVSGTVAGSSVVDASTFFGFEHPLAKSEVHDGAVKMLLTRVLPLQSHQAITYSSVIGVSDPAQMRRSFLAYLERERVHPYRTFLTYNSWYDLGYGERYDEAGALNRVNAFGEELVRRRGVTLDSFLFDDGWDNARSLWQFDAGFPNGFTRVGEAAGKYQAGIGVWLSPWGGYDVAKKQRIAYGREHGYEIVKDGYALSGPRYYQAFEQTCLEMMAKYRVNQFKFDGTGNADQVFPGSAYDSDFDAAIHLIDRLRQQEPSIFINLTTGTYPSPWWLEYADSIWRGGEDHAFAGVGDWRQKWITYRDAQTYKHIVQAGPLFPLNSLMLHGIVKAREAEHLGAGPGSAKGPDAGSDPEGAAADKDFAEEAWSLFGSGTDMQELYITPSLMNTANWDVLAEAAKWARRNSAVLRDTHWIGGDPGALAIYGWAAWTPEMGTITLRNPSDHPQTFKLDAQAAFELPTGSPRSFRMVSIGSERSAKLPAALRVGVPETITLAPFEVITLEAHPEGSA